jgi:hypothetical protein
MLNRMKNKLKVYGYTQFDAGGTCGEVWSNKTDINSQ